MDYKLDCGILQGVFAVPNCVVDKHIKLAGAAQLKVLLFLLRHSGEQAGCEEIALQLGFSPADIRDAVNYWAEVGVFSAQADACVQDAANVRPAQTAPAQPVQDTYGQPAFSDSSAGTPVVENGNVKKLTTSYRFTQKEAFTRLQGNEELRFLVEQCKLLLARELQGGDVVSLVSIHDWIGLSPDVIVMAVEYCASCGKTDMRSIERQCAAWADAGVNTHEKADNYIREQAARHTREALVRGAFGIAGRNLSTKERELIARWFDEYGYDLAVIRLAYDKTVDNTGKLSFAYLDRILANWHSKGIKTAEEAAAESAVKPQKSVSSSLDLSLIENEGIYTTKDI